MAETYAIAAEARDRAGKGAARATRRAGKVPGVIYGGGAAPVLISLNQRDLAKLLRDPAYTTHLYGLSLGSETHSVLTRDVQRHPVTDEPIHVDFQRVSAASRIAIEVPVQFVNEAASPGLKRGGVLNVVRFTIEVTCRADTIPESIKVDLTGLDVGDSVHISAVKLPEGVQPTILDRDFTIASIAAPSAVRSEAAEAAATPATAETPKSGS